MEGCLNVTAKLVKVPSINVTCSVICSIAGSYLMVTPKVPQWITEYNPAVYDVESNTRWQVDY